LVTEFAGGAVIVPDSPTFDVQVMTQVADAETGHVPVPPVRDFNDRH
jgi:hypothetical protein